MLKRKTKILCASALTALMLSSPLIAYSAPLPSKNVNATVTFYAAYDNDPPNSKVIAYPKRDGFTTIHNEAGGLGTFEDPITAAVKDTKTFPIGSKVYYSALKKYFVVEDECANCKANGKPAVWIDLYAGDAVDSKVLSCENELTPDGKASVEINAPLGRVVNSTPIYSNGKCYKDNVPVNPPTVFLVCPPVVHPVLGQKVICEYK